MMRGWECGGGRGECGRRGRRMGNEILHLLFHSSRGICTGHACSWAPCTARLHALSLRRPTPSSPQSFELLGRFLVLLRQSPVQRVSYTNVDRTTLLGRPARRVRIPSTFLFLGPYLQVSLMQIATSSPRSGFS